MIFLLPHIVYACYFWSYSYYFWIYSCSMRTLRLFKIFVLLMLFLPPHIAYACYFWIYTCSMCSLVYSRYSCCLILPTQTSSAHMISCCSCYFCCLTSSTPVTSESTRCYFWIYSFYFWIYSCYSPFPRKWDSKCSSECKSKSSMVGTL